MNFTLITSLALLGFAAMPGKALAQAAAPMPMMIAPSFGTLSATARLRMPHNVSLELTPTVGERMMQQRSGKRSQGAILMIVGAAGIVTGLLVDEDVVTVAGAVVGGFGLYRYLQDSDWDKRRRRGPDREASHDLLRATS